MSSFETFTRFSATHAIVVGVCAAITLGLVACARRSSEIGRARLRVRLGVVVLLVQIAHNAYWLVFRHDSDSALPLHLCDAAGFVAVLAFLVPVRLAKSLLYFWGVGLSSLAFVIPVITVGPATVEFWSFWISHLVVVGGAIYLAAGDGYAPTWRDCLAAVLITWGYGLVMIPINDHLGTNYVYVGEHSPPAEFLGDWPFPRLPLLAASAAFLMFLAYAGFALPNRLFRKNKP